MDIIYSRFRIPKLNRTKINDPKRIVFIFVIIVIIIAYSTAVTIIKAINPTLELQSKSFARAMAESLSNKACQAEMEGKQYKDLCTIERDDNGNIKLMHLNVINVNKITSKISLNIQEELMKENNAIISISVGSISGNKLLAGRGPNIKVKVQALGDIQATVKSEFCDAGINQTLHKIYLSINCKMCVISPYKDTVEDVTTEVLLAEAIIVGDIPETYYNLHGLNASDTMNVF